MNSKKGKTFETNRLLYEHIMVFINDIKTDKYRGTEEIYGRVLKFVKEVCRDVFKLPPACWEIVEEFQRHESILYNLSGYRDHYIHQANVFLLGYYIINKMGIDKLEKILFSSIRDKYPATVNEVDVLKIWFLTSFFHDVAYAIQKTPALIDVFLREVLGRGEADEEKKVVADGNWGLILNWNDNLYHLDELQRYFYGDDKEMKRLINKVVHDALTSYQDHGVFSALILLNRLSGGVEKDPVSFYTAGLSILLHNKLVWQNLKEENVFEKIKFSEHPIAFLLMYCDNVQEWGRQIKSTTTSRQGPKIREIRCECGSNKTETFCELEYEQRISRVGQGLDEFIEEAPEHWSSGENYYFEISFRGIGGRKSVDFP